MIDRSTVEEYLRQDLAELDKPERKDRARALEEVSLSARLYYAGWVSVLQKPEEEMKQGLMA